VAGLVVDNRDQGGGAGAVTSVNTMTGDVVLTKVHLGLGNVDNTSDADKPISTATQTALDAKAPLAAAVPTGGSQYQALVKNSSTNYDAGWSYPRIHPRYGYILSESFTSTIDANRVGDLGWVGTVASGGALGSSNTGATANNCGVCRMNAGTTSSSGNATISLGGSAGSGTSVILGAHTYTFEAELYIGALATAAQDFTFRFGLIGTSSSTATSNGVFFEYDRATSGDFWRLRSVAGGVSTVTVSAAPVTIAWTVFKMVVNAAATSCEFFVNDVSVGTVTGIPSGVSQSTCPGFQLAKTVGTADRAVYIDWCDMIYIKGA
jgi:hypothetical protein